MKSLLPLTLLLLLSSGIKAQFLQFSMYVDTEVTAGVVQELNFGNILPNSVLRVNPDQNNSGWFQLVVLNASELELVIEADDQMISLDEPDCEDDSCRFRFELGFSYYVSDQPDIRITNDLIPLQKGSNFINVPFVEVRRRAGFADYIYININVSGQIEVGDVRPGVYTGEVNLFITY